MQSFDPENRWKSGMKKQCTYALVQGAQGASGFAVLLRSVGAQEPEQDAMLRVKLSKDRVIKLASIVYLEGAYWTGELCASISMKRHDMFGDIRFVTQWEGPDKVRKII